MSAQKTIGKHNNIISVQLQKANFYHFLLAAVALLWCVVSATPARAGMPIITSFSPQSGAVGTVVNISGLNFDPTLGNNIVYFGAVRAVVTTASVTNLVVTVPVGATYAPITETVNGLTAYANQPFMPTFSGNGHIDNTSLAPRLDLPAGDGPGQIAIGDLDGDGKPDLVVANSYDQTVWVYRNTSTKGTLTEASFAPPVVLPLMGSGTTPWPYWNVMVALADMDGDGRLDIVASNGYYNLVSVFKNLCLPGSITTNSFGNRVDFSVTGSPTDIAVMDLDGDGKPEIITVNYSSSTVSVLRNIGSSGTITTNSFAAPVSFPVAPSPHQMAIADLDGDGKPDIVTVNFVDWSTDTKNQVSVLRNISTTGNISFASTVNFPGVPTSCNLAIGDLDGDGKLDMVVSSFNYGQAVSVYRNISTPGSITTNSFASHVDFAVGGWGNDVAIGDLDGDGIPDLAVVTQLPDHLSLFKNISVPGNFTTNSLAPRVDFTAGYNPNGVAIGDLDGDGRPDIVFGNSYDNTISIYRNVIPVNYPPVANAGPNQTVYAWIDGLADVTLDGSDSNDADGDELTYKWMWTIDGNDYEANGVKPTIELPVGQYVISLIVNDGIVDSEPNEVVITVVGPIEANLCVTPKVLNCKSLMPRIMATLLLPKGITKDQIDSNEPILLYPGEIEAGWTWISRDFDYKCRVWNTTIFASFDKNALMNAIDSNGLVELVVVGQLKTGQYFYGTDNIRVISPGNWPQHKPWCDYRWNRWHQRPCNFQH